MSSSDFVIESGALKVYNGPGGDVTIPPSVTCIGNGAFRGCSSLISVTIPESVTRIGNNAFEWCSNLTRVTIPESVMSIGNDAFWRCTSLINAGPTGSGCDYQFGWTESIPSNAFRGCSSLTSISIPEGITRIGDNAFTGCYSLTSVSIPDGVTSIGERAFSECSRLKSVVFPNNGILIGDCVFNGCSNLKDVILPTDLNTMPETAFDGIVSEDVHFLLPNMYQFGKQKISSLICTGHISYIDSDLTSDDLACIALYQKSKRWQNWLRQGNVKEPDSVLRSILALLRQESNVTKQVGMQATQFAKDFGKRLSRDDIANLVALLREKKWSGSKALEKDAELMLLITAKATEEHPIEALVRERLAVDSFDKSVQKMVKSGVRYADREELSSREAVLYILSESKREWDRCADFWGGELGAISVLMDAKKVHLSKIADQVAAALDRRSLSAFLEEQVGGNYYRYSLLAFARYADDRGIENVCSNYKALSRGRAKERYKADNLKEALLLSDTRAAMLFYDRIGELDRYAALHNMSAVDMRDSVMLPDFALDEDGKKRYDIGGNIVEVGFSPELELTLYDVNKGKVVRSFPKKSDDPAKAETAAKEFAAFKKDITDFLKLRTEQLHKMHLSGDTVKPELWHKVYVEHPVIRLLSQLVIWMDESKHTFTVLDAETVDSELRPYTPQGSIHVAHVLEMNAADIAAWQEMLRGQKKKQLFEQVWEPIIPWEEKELQTRYEGACVLAKDRNELKKRLKQRGVDVRSADMDREYDPHTGQYKFNGKSTMLFGDCLAIDYSSEGEEIVLGEANIKAEQGNREINVVLLELDRLMAVEHIREDRAETLSESLLSTFTIAQITEFIELSIASEATACTAALLNYKNEHYPEYVDMSGFSLDW